MRQVRVASAPLTAGPSITRGAGERPRSPALPTAASPRSRSPAPPSAQLRQLGALRRRRRQENGGGLCRPASNLQTPTVSDPRHRRQFRPLPVYRDPVFLPRPPGAMSAASDLRWRRMNTERGFRKPPPPSLKSSRGRSGGVDRLRGLGGARERGAAGASTGSALPARDGRGRGRRPFAGGWTRIGSAAREALVRQAGSSSPS